MFHEQNAIAIKNFPTLRILFLTLNVRQDRNVCHVSICINFSNICGPSLQNKIFLKMAKMSACIVQTYDDSTSILNVRQSLLGVMALYVGQCTFCNDNCWF